MALIEGQNFVRVNGPEETGINMPAHLAYLKVKHIHKLHVSYGIIWNSIHVNGTFGYP